MLTLGVRYTLNKDYRLNKQNGFQINGDNRFVYITLKYVNSNKKPEDTEYIENPDSSVMCGYDDILFVRTGATGLIVTNVFGVYHNNFFKIIFEKILLSKKYLIGYLSQKSIQAHFNLLAGTTTISDLNHGDFLSTKVLIPPLSEQQEIASFLDTKCSLIDTTIEKEREVIDKLKEYRQAVITEAVTKGIRAGVPMKDSGVEWIGKIPEGWNKRKLYGLLRSIGSGTTPKSNPLYYDGEYPWLNTGDLADDLIQNVNKSVTELAIQDHSPLKLYDAPSVVIALYGATIGKLGITTYPLTVNQACCVMTTKPDLDYKYLFYALLGIRKYLFILSYGAGQPNISGETIKSLQIPHPPVTEQHEIIEYLDAKCSDIDATIQKRELAIEKLTAYKQSLIYECVTGKKEVLA